MSEMVFGPVPSRRLGRSLGINNIPPKICSYACVYCQLGRTICLQIERKPYYGVDEIMAQVSQRVEQLSGGGEVIDYLTFVPDGEPTLDIHIGKEIEALKSLGIPIAVISNGSLLWREDVRADLMQADWVSVKVDAVDEPTWRRVNRPHGGISLNTVLEGVQAFAKQFEGALMTETMLVGDINVERSTLYDLAQFLAQLAPQTVYLSIPTRPPAEDWVRTPTENAVTQAYHILTEAHLRVELLTGYEGSEFSSTGNPEQDILSITAVHPLREDALRVLLEEAGEDWGLVENLLEKGQLVMNQYEGNRFYLRYFGNRQN